MATLGKRRVRRKRVVAQPVVCSSNNSPDMQKKKMHPDGQLEVGVTPHEPRA